jgi:hypothetical protein
MIVPMLPIIEVANVNQYYTTKVGMHKEKKGLEPTLMEITTVLI